MTRGTSGLGVPLVVLAALTLLAVRAITAQQPAPFTTNTNLVVVPVVAVDSKGASVDGLTQDQFQIFEDGKPVPIQTFVAPIGTTPAGDEGRFVVLALDNLLTSAEIAYRLKNIAKMFVERLGPRDVMSVIAINRGRATTTQSKTELLAAIDRFRPAFGEDTWTAAQKTEHGLRMISSLTDQLAKSTHRRKVFVFIGDAGMFSPQEASAFNDRGNDLSPEWMEAIRATSRNNVAIYTIDPKGLSGSKSDWSESFAAETGGYAWSRTNNFRSAVERVWLEAGTYYLIGYAAPINDQRLHKIEVKVTRSGVTVRARRARG